MLKRCACSSSSSGQVMARALHLRLARGYLCLCLLHHYIRTRVPERREACALRSLREIRQVPESGIVKSIISYRQTGGYATVMFHHKCERMCLYSRSGVHRIQTINAIVHGLMSLEIDGLSNNAEWSKGYNIEFGDEVLRCVLYDY